MMHGGQGNLGHPLTQHFFISCGGADKCNVDGVCKRCGGYLSFRRCIVWSRRIRSCIYVVIDRTGRYIEGHWRSVDGSSCLIVA